MAKKNFARPSFSASINKELGYIEPIINTGKKYYVDFYVYDPGNEKMQRVKRHFDGIKNKRERLDAMKRNCREIGNKLSGRWNPIMQDRSAGLILLNSVLKNYIDSLNRYFRRKTKNVLKDKVNI